jgi:N-acetylglucosamine kinase-like BadF-type ATPase
MSAHPDSAAELVLAVDAGGSKTAACLARATGPSNYEILGRGRAGGANPLSSGFDRAIAAIAAAVAGAAADANLPGALVARAVFSIAGAADPVIAGEFVRSAREAQLARRIAVVSDVLPVLVAGADHGAGVALVAGTGSVAFGRAEDGRTIRCGGWGYLLGDDGSGFAIGRAALRFALEDLETNRDTLQPLTMALVSELQSTAAAEIIKAIYTSSSPRATIASLTPRVAQLAEAGDPDAKMVLDEAARDLARLAVRTAQLLELGDRTVPLAMAGGVLVGSTYLREAVTGQLATMGLRIQMRLVADPLEGCLRLADPEFSGSLVHWH